MLNYVKTVWKDSPETEITAERLNNMEEGIFNAHELLKILSERSHVGMIIHSTTLDTMEKVIAIYGGIRWEKTEGRFLLGANSSYPVNTTGGEASVTLKNAEMPSHIHYTRGYYTLPPETAGVDYARQVISRTSIGSDPVDTNANILSTGGNQPHNNMPPYKAVYIWERVE